MSVMVCNELCMGIGMGRCSRATLVAQGVALRGRAPEMIFAPFGTGGLTLPCRGCEGWLEGGWHPVVSGKEDVTA